MDDNSINEKEKTLEKIISELPKEDKDKEDSFFINQDNENMQKDNVIKEVDEMGKGLKKNEAKAISILCSRVFYLVCAG